MRLFDTHAHLDDEQIHPILESMLSEAKKAGVVGINAIGTTLESSQRCLGLASKYDCIFASVGIHPNNCHQATDDQWDAIMNMASKDEVVAIGETGLDLYWDTCPLEVQKEWFSRHIDLSFTTQKPLVIHMRQCEPEMREVLSQHQRDGHIIGVMHSFAGQWETARHCLDLGMYISFAGMVTFKKSEELREIAAKVPADRILVETDSPYLTPHPHRGKHPNTPTMVQHTADCIAKVRGLPLDEFAELTTVNAQTLFGVSV